MNSAMRIKNKKEFQDILKTGFKISNNFFGIYFKDKQKEISRFGITLSKNFGNAVKRNHYKRITREIIRNNQNIFEKTKDYIIIVKKSCESLPFHEISNELVNLLQKRR